MDPGTALIPLWLKLVYTGFLAFLVPVYLRHHGARNFFWFCDIALLVTLAALWLENALLASMMAVSVLLPEIAWNVSFLRGLLFGKPESRWTDYMFDPNRPRYLRALSLFHLFLPILLLWLVWRLGYEPDAVMLQTLLTWLVLPLTRWLTPEKDNINWVYHFMGRRDLALPAAPHVLALMAALPLLVYLPTHWILLWLPG